MLKLMDLLTEGVHDSGIFKAVFLAGGPGSGKSYIAKQIFGIPEKFNISMSGMKMINQDKEYKFLLKKHGFDPEWLDTYPDDVFQHITDEMRDFTRDLAVERKKGYMKGKLGMIIDGTGHKFQKIKAHKKELEDNGYDTYMAFVNTSLEVALERNIARGEKGDRVLPDNIVKKSWQDTRKNLGGYKALFSGKFALIDNSQFLDADTARHKFTNLVKDHIQQWSTEPIKNSIGQKWVQDQFKLKKAGIK